MRYKELAKIFKVLGDETRLKILDLLFEGEKCVCEIVERTEKSQPTISIHLAKLEEAGIVCSRKEGKKVFYRLVEPRVKRVLEILTNR